MADITPVAAPAPVAAPVAPVVPPAPVAAETQPAVQPVVKDGIESLEGMESMSDLEAILDQSLTSEIVVDGEVKKPEVTEVKPPVAAPALPVPPVTPPADNADEYVDGKPLPKNFRFSNPTQQKLALLMKQHPEASVTELARLAEGLPAAAPVPQNQTPPAEVVAPPVQETVDGDQRVKAQSDKIAVLLEQRKKAIADYDAEGQATIDEQLMDAKLDLRDVRQQVANEVAQLQHFEAQSDASKVMARSLCPETTQPGTPQFEEIQREIAFLESQRSPIMDRPDYPLEVLKRVAARSPALFPNVKMPYGTPVAAVPAQPVAQPPPARLANGQVESPGATAAPTLTPQSAAKAIEDMSLEELEAVSDISGTQRR